ncbi:MAG: hypothetical protein O7E52_15425 [Candidatus Poribacteria bacterium]|nr:hypothetical protein [Candidatus Poribacteria bacterium]
MPIVDIEILQNESSEPMAVDLPQRIADSLGDVFETQSAQTWVKVHYHQRTHYAENHSILPYEIKPVMVKILKRQLADSDVLKEEASRVAETVATICHCPVANVHVLYEPQGLGRIAFGGVLETND